MIGSTPTARPTSQLAGLALSAGLATLGALVVLGSHRPLLLVAAPIGGIGLILAAQRPRLALSLMVVIEVSNVSGVLTPRTGIPIFQLSLLLGLLAVGFALKDPHVRNRLNAWTVICAGFLAVYLATQAVATIGSVDVAVSLSEMRRMILDCLFVMVVLALIQLTARPWMAAAAVVIPLAMLSTLSVIDQLVFGGSASFSGFSTVTTASGELLTTLRYGGPLPDSNFWGRHLVMGLPLAAALLTRALRSGRRSVVTVWVLAVVAQLAGIYLTQSRGTFLAAGVAIATWFIASERSVRRWGLALSPLALLAFAVPGVGNRLVAALGDVTQARVNYDLDPSILGRLAAQQEAWMMFQARPYFGFGPATFPGQVIEFAGRVPIAVREPTNAPHNLYVEFAAQSGFTGLLGWAAVILGFLTVAVLGIIVRPRSADRVLLAGVCAAIIAWSAASIGLHMAYFRTLGVVLALAGGLAPAWPVPVEAARRLFRYAAVWLVAGFLGLSTFWLCLSANSSPAVTATQRVTLLPVGPIDGWYSYALDIRSRVELLPTFAIMMGDQVSPVDVVADPVRGLLTFTATADRVDKARDEIQLAVAQAETILHSSIGYQQYSLQTVGSMSTAASHKRSSLVVFVALAVGAGTALVTGLALSWTARSRRGDHPPDRPLKQELASSCPTNP